MEICLSTLGARWTGGEPSRLQSMGSLSHSLFSLNPSPRMALLFSPGCHSGGGLRPVSCLRGSAAGDPSTVAVSQGLDAVHIRRAAELAELSAGLTSPHPNFGCVIANGRDVAGEGFLYAQGTKCAELQAVEAAGERCRGATAYLNLEPGDCYADHTPVSALLKV